MIELRSSILQLIILNITSYYQLTVKNVQNVFQLHQQDVCQQGRTFTQCLPYQCKQGLLWNFHVVWVMFLQEVNLGNVQMERSRQKTSLLHVLQQVCFMICHCSIINNFSMLFVVGQQITKKRAKEENTSYSKFVLFKL